MDDPLGSDEAAIHAAFADREPILYIQQGTPLEPIFAIRSALRAPDFAGPGQTLHQVTYELRRADISDRPSNGETFTHRGRRWRVLQVEDLDDVGAWLVTVTDAGAAA